MVGLNNAAAPEESEDMESDGDVAPENQAIYDQVVGNAYDVIDDEGGKNERFVKIMDRIKKAVDFGDPKEGLASAVVNVLVPVFLDGKKNGVEITGDVMIAAAEEVMGRLAEDAERLKIHSYTEEEMNGAFIRAVDAGREMLQQAGAIDQESAKQEFAQIAQAENSGQLEQLLPGISEAAKRFGGSAGMSKGEKPAEDEGEE